MCSSKHAITRQAQAVGYRAAMLRLCQLVEACRGCLDAPINMVRPTLWAVASCYAPCRHVAIFMLQTSTATQKRQLTRVLNDLKSAPSWIQVGSRAVVTGSHHPRIPFMSGTPQRHLNSFIELCCPLRQSRRTSTACKPKTATSRTGTSSARLPRPRCCSAVGINVRSLTTDSYPHRPWPLQQRHSGAAGGAHIQRASDRPAAVDGCGGPQRGNCT
jgi:hypothetical protein